MGENPPFCGNHHHDPTSPAKKTSPKNPKQEFGY